MRNVRTRDPFSDLIDGLNATRKAAPDHHERCQYWRDRDASIADASRIVAPLWKATQTSSDFWAEERRLDRLDWREDRIRDGLWVPAEDDELES